MGYRVELGEIEQTLSRVPEMTQAAAVYHRRYNNYSRLIGFVAADASVDDRDILDKLANFFPDYIAPSRWVIMDAPSKNSNGKIDKHALLGTVDGVRPCPRD
ncbi:AMP-binding enzyme C-terminal domain-containing protein [Rhizobium sp. RU36D]|nr:AMP-binding enzyme C-terminal domain-containing protein [Rhizobium sp. RU36D]